ncbi:hypothetical protein TraAM80_05030 [Trypanosoma rangeli]|uniref:Uncharacterized protein n=1 Tax=Trypanosoma rangeli TaxID=5698 RepID=A0A3R7KBK6_TRYRA|nr:uncharacterized protein TraAM80_05030 [Trypanosoma rangeli]RNF04892.1 hypothetical protein TraAM80_05030 [Trypanosoma rangeli]|eukprot:RNF04892.1 hypothetical protein TraAM80_05030 [Trypanosoma rangeli]
MLQRCWLPRCPVQYTALSAAAGQLNGLLDLRATKQPVPSDVLKQFLRTDVMPLLRGTTVDRRHDSSELRRLMSQLLRDSAFAAVVLRARPDGTYVNALAECVKHDHERMQFLQKMTSNQASRVIEHLCRVGVRDSTVYAPLAARLDFHLLKPVGRAMFALAEEGMYQEVVAYIVPLYCGETWTLTFDGGVGYINQLNKNCNVFDAVRLLRVLSKAVRGVVEQQRLDAAKGAVYPLPVESIQKLRTNLTAFIIDNSEVLRGGHWINFTRAMVHFPLEFKTMKYLERHPSVVRVLDAQRLPRRDARRGLSDTVDTDDMAALGLNCVFAPVEQPQQHPQQHMAGGDETRKKPCFDVPSIDLTKLLSIIEDVPIPRALQQRRRQLVIRAIVDDMNKLHFTDLVRFIHALRRVEGSTEFSSSLNAAVAAVSQVLEQGQKNAAVYIPYDRLLSLANLLTAFRVKSCKGFVNYLLCFLPTVNFMTVGEATSLMNALVTVAEVDGVQLCSCVGGQILDKVGLSLEDDLPALVLAYPLPCAKLLRTTVMLSVAPSSSALRRIFGSTEEALKVSPALREVGASVLFDVARSLYHFSRLKPADTDWTETVWCRGIVGALMPLLTQFTSEFYQEVLAGEAGGRWSTSYVPLAWRSAAETVFSWVDVNLDTVSLTTMQQRIEAVYPFCRQIATMAVGVAETQRQMLLKHPTAEPLAFSCNAIVHMLSFLLVLEHMLYHGTWQAELDSGGCAAARVKKKIQAMKADYVTSLSTPVCKDEQGGDVTALVLIRRLFSCGGLCDQSPPLLDRSSILEITTNLPFSVSLVVSQGPINELFCEQAAAAVVGVDA